MLRVCGVMIRRVEEEFDKIEHGPSAKGIKISALFVPQVRVSLVVEHLIGR